jgi:phosphoglycolate phosphatase
MTSIEAAVVDLDGTMVDTLGDFVVALNLMLADLSLPRVDRAVVEALVGKGSEHLIHSVLLHVMNQPPAHKNQASPAINSGANSGVAECFPVAWASYQRHYLSINGQHAAVYPGVLEGLRRLQDHGLALACLTNKPAAFALPLLKAKGLDGFFGQVFGGDAFERKKPDPLPLRKTCEALGTLPARTLMIGDSSNDALAARAAGCPVVLVTYGYNHGEPVRAVDADGFVDTLADIDLARIKTTTGLAPR